MPGQLGPGIFQAGNKETEAKHLVGPRIGSSSLSNSSLECVVFSEEKMALLIGNKARREAGDVQRGKGVKWKEGWAWLRFQPWLFYLLVGQTQVGTLFL